MKKAIVLGGTNPHIELIKKLQSRGYYVILVDYLTNPPAKNYADLHIQESTMDNEKVLKIAKEYNVELVISACVDQANITACYVAEKLNLTKPYSYETAYNITNKGYMKKIMSENSIPTSKYLYFNNNTCIEDFDLSYPVMVKPADCCASSGVKKAKNQEELRNYLNDAISISRNSRAVVEEFCKGIEVSVYSFISNKKANIIMISQRLSVIEGENQVLKCYATVAPAEINNVALDKIQKAADGIAKAFNLDNTPLHVQVMIDGNDISVIEFAPRVGGGISYQTIRENTGFDIIDATIDSYLEQNVELNYHKPEYYYTVNLIYANPGKFDRLEGYQELVESGVIDSLHFHKTKGMLIEDDRASAGRVAAFLIKSKSKQNVLQRIKLAVEKMEVYDDCGNEIMRKDLFIKEL